MASLVDTNVLVYACDPRDPAKQRRALSLLERGAEDGSLVLPFQAAVEFVSVATRRGGPGTPLLELHDAITHLDRLLQQFELLLPTEEVLRTALTGAAVYHLPWYDALLWAYAEANGIPEILSEDFQGGRVYGKVRVVDPFTRPTD